MRLAYPSTAARATSPIALSRGAVVAAFLLVTLVVALFLAGTGAAELLYRTLIEGVVLSAWLCAGYGIGAIVLARTRALDDAPAVLRRIVCTALGLGALGLLVLGFGLSGLLNRTAAAVVIGVGDLLFLWQARVWLRAEGRGAIAQWMREPARRLWLWVLAAPVCGIVLVAALVP